jgi:hypothetical protein
MNFLISVNMNFFNKFNSLMKEDIPLRESCIKINKFLKLQFLYPYICPN